jgi:serine/threonine protein kinase
MLQCDHPNIGRLLRLDRQRVDGAEYVYSIEEFVGGGTLSDLVITRGLLNVEQAKAIGASLVSAVSHIAARGLVHRDIKPENIMLREDTVTPVLVDFGLVRLLNEPSITVSWAERGPGTPYFASPEQLRNEKHLIDWRADQFSLGVTLACVILGRHPYAMSVDEDMAATVDRVADREHVPTAFVDDVAKFGLPVLARMVSPWPVNRYREPTVLVEAWAKQ